MTDDKTTLYDKVLNWLKNQPIIVGLLILILIYLGITEVIKATKANKNAIEEIVSPSINKPTAQNPTDSNEIKPQGNLENPSSNHRNIKLYSISIVTKPDQANIFINEQFVGKSDRQVKLPKGEYRLKIEKNGYETFEDIISVPSQTIIPITLTQ